MDSTQCSFDGKTLAVPYAYNTKTMPLYEACMNFNRKTFAVILKTTKNAKVTQYDYTKIP